MSGAISSALLAIDLLTGTNFTASGNPVLLDTHIAMNSALVVNDTADHVINATESTAVAFTVSGLARGETGALTFADASNHEVVVDVGGNGTYSANLSTLTDGTITSSLAATDPNGVDASAAGNAVQLDTDSALKPSLSVDATIPSHVTFTVSGLEGDESGTVTFTDPSGRQDVVDIGSNGTYSANLSNLTDGTITYLMRVTDLAGNVTTVDPPLNLGDGSANAPTGNPQLPNLLSGYAARPSWNVAGVDYAVGINSGVTLKDPLPNGSLAPALVALGGSYNSSNHLITFSGVNNIAISGWDFSLHNGLGIYIQNSSGATITNNNFQIGTNQATPIQLTSSSTNVNVSDNVINGAGLPAVNLSQGLIETNSPSLTVQYNLIENAFAELIRAGSVSTTFNNTIQYNIIENSGMGQNQGAHGDWMQILSAPGDNVSNFVVDFNTFIQSLPPSTAQTQGISFNGNVGGNFLNEVVSNNTMIAAPNTNVINTFVNSDMSWLNGTLTVSGNYIDPTGLQNIASWLTPVGGTGPYSGTTATSNNFNMKSASYFTQNETSVRQVVTSPSSGTELPGNTITLTVGFSAAVTVTGAPTLTLNDGGTATYVGGSGTNALAFIYTVGASDSAVSALAITQVNLPTGATIKDRSGKAADLSNALTTFWNLAIDPPLGPTPISVIESPSTGDLKAANTVSLTLNLSSAVTVAGGTPTLTLNDGGTAIYTGGSGTNALTFSYTVGAGQNASSLAASAVNLNGATVKDGSGNAASLSLSGLTHRRSIPRRR
jgi:Right handed beta helix region